MIIIYLAAIFNFVLLWGNFLTQTPLDFFGTLALTFALIGWCAFAHMSTK